MSELRFLPPLQKGLKNDICDRKEWKKILKSQKSGEKKHLTYKNRSKSLQDNYYFAENVISRRSSVPVDAQMKSPNSQSGSPKSESNALQATYNLQSPTTLFGDQHMLLQASQILEKLSKIQQQNSEQSPDKQISAGICEIKKISYYHKKLKLLLQHQCLINLKKECMIHVQSAEKFVSEVKQIAVKEYVKLKYVLDMMKMSAIHESGVYLGSVRSLIDDLTLHIGLWPSLLRSVSRALNILHVGWNPTFEILLIQTHRTLQGLERQALFWVRRILDIDFSIICLSDVHSISSDVMQNIFQTFQNFNKLIQVDNDTIKDFDFCYIHSFQRDIYCTMCQTVPFLFSHAIQLSASYEGKVAAKTISSFLTTECEKLPINKHEEFKWIPDMINLGNKNKLSDTSDYYSASFSEIGFGRTNNAIINNSSSVTEGTSNMDDIMNDVIQSNQTLLLKFLFAFACVKIQPDKEATVTGIQKNNQEFHASRQMWQIPAKRASSESSTHLEHIFWHYFWQELGQEVIFLMTNLLPQFSSLPRSSLQPLSFFSTSVQKSILKLIQHFKSDNDTSSKATEVMKEIYNMLFSHICVMTWDERLCVALATIYSTRCVPIPLIEGAAGTNQGNLICAILEPLVGSLLLLIPAGYYTKAAQVAACLNCSSNYAVKWAKEKRRMFLASWNVSLYLLISCTDLEMVKKCLQNLKAITLNDFIEDTGIKIQLKETWKSVLETMNFIENIGSHIFNELNNKAYSYGLETFTELMPVRNYWKRLRADLKTSDYIQESVQNILVGAMQTLSHLTHDHQLVVGTAVVDGFVHSWLDFIWNKKIKFSQLGASQFCKDVDFVIDWLDNLPLTPEVKHKVLTVDYIRKLNYVTQVLSNAVPRLHHLSWSRNKIAPIVINNSSNKQNQENRRRVNLDPVLTDDDKQQWDNLVVSDHYFFPSCFCCF